MKSRRAARGARLAIAVSAVMGGVLLWAALAGAASLPDGRGYEMVSPPSGKNGADVMANSQRFRTADDGSAAAFATLTPFGDPVGTGVATDYMSIRTGQAGTSGWVTHAVTPKQQPLTLNGLLASDPLYVGDFSSDLTRGVFLAWSPVTDDPNVADAQNLYVRTDLRSSGAGTYQLASPCPRCDTAGRPLPPAPDVGYEPFYGGASADFQQAIFESFLNLTDDAPAQPSSCDTSPFTCMPRAYEWNAGQFQLVGLVPPSGETSCGPGGPACVVALASAIGPQLSTSSFRPDHAISSDGRRVFFMVPTDGSGAVTTGRQLSGRLYMRTDGTTTDELDASERTTPVAYSPARYWGASVDGSRVFFSTSEALTDDAPPNGDRKLYMYDTTKPASDPHNLTYINVDNERGDTSNDLQGVIGVSADGQYVYFITSGQLVPGGPLLDTGWGYYMWHDGQVNFIGRLLQLFDDTNDLLPSTNWFISTSQARVTPDGRHLVLTSHNGSGFPLNYDHGSCGGFGCREVYVYSADTSTPLGPDLVCASCNPSGAPATVDATDAVKANTGASHTTWHLNRPITDDGSRVFFTTAEALVPQDVNGKQDAYEYVLPTSDQPRGQLFLISSGTSTSDSYFMETTPSGSDAFFITRERLVGWDRDDAYDLYDARVGGGLPDPAPTPVDCSISGTCQGLPGAAPGSVHVGSNAFAGAGDLHGTLKARRAPKRCRRGFVRKRVRGRVRCVRRVHKHGAKRATRAAASTERSAK